MTTALSIDLEDPGVRRMLHPGPETGGRGRVVQLAGDAAPGGWQGLSSTTYLEQGKHEVVVVYKDMFLTVDVYLVPGQQPEIHIICPRCHKASRISGANKRISFEPREVNPAWLEAVKANHRDLAAIAVVGRLSVEPFECTWEVGDAKHAPGAVHTGVSLCRQKLVIDDNRAKDA